MLPLTFGQWLKQLRAAHDWTQEMLAEQIGCATPTLRSFEIGRRRPSREMAERIADILQVPPAQQAEFLRLARLPVEASREPAEDNEGPPPENTHPLPSLPPLPQPLQALIGREAETKALSALVRDERCALVTVLGAGGMGKTRLALEVAHQVAAACAEGVAFVPLAPLRTAQHLPSAIAEAVGLNLQGSSAPQEQVLAWLTNRQLLLVLDNFEHLLGEDDAVAWLAQLGQVAPQLQLLVTSRERLRLRGEQIFELGGLALPDATTTPEQADAVILFLERAQHASHGFVLEAANKPAIVRICQLLEGMPLGLELAAAWVHVLSVEEIAEEIAKNIDFLALADRDALPRHRSMRAVFEQSWRLLSPEERTVLMKLAVFRGGCTREAAGAVAGATLPVLANLIDKSLVRRLGERRFDLHELIRQFAGQQLAAAQQVEATKTLQLAFFQQFARKAEVGMNQAEQRQWFVQVEQELDNLRAVLAWAFPDAAPPAPAHVTLGLQLLAALYRFWQGRGHLTEARLWLERGLAQAQQVAPVVVAQTLNILGWLAHQQGESVYARARLEESLALFRQAQDQQGIAEVLDTLGDLAWAAGDLARGVACYTESLAWRRQAGQPHQVAMSLYSLGRLYVDHQQNQAAQPCFAEAMRLLETLGDQRGLALTINGLGRLALNEQAYALAGERFRNALRRFHQLGNQVDTAECFEELALVAYATGDPQRAALLWAAGEALRQEIHIQPLLYNQRLAAPLLAALSPAMLETARATARQRSLHAAVTDALGE